MGFKSSKIKTIPSLLSTKTPNIPSFGSMEEVTNAKDIFLSSQIQPFSIISK